MTSAIGIALSWLVCLEAALSLREIVACMALALLLTFPFAKLIINSMDDKKDTEVQPVSGLVVMSFLHGVSLASIAKAAIYTKRMSGG